jgi:hypothetical protein
MRKYLIPIVAAASALAIAAPASAQYYHAPAYGYRYGSVEVRQWQNDLQRIRFEMRNLQAQGRLTYRERRDLQNDINTAEYSIERSRYHGITPYEARAIGDRLARLRYEVRRYSDYDRRYGYRRY